MNRHMENTTFFSTRMKWFQLESRTIEKALSKVGERGDDDDGLSLLKSFGYSIKQITLLLKE